MKSALLVAGLFGCTAQVLEFRSFSDTYQEVPPPANKVPEEASATAFYTLDPSTGEVIVGEGSTYSDLTGDATSCHIHMGFRGKDGPALLTLSCVDGIISGGGTLAEDDISLFMEGDTYLNIHTMANLPGEIRGQIEPYTANEAIKHRSFSDTYQEVPPPINKVPEKATATAYYTLNEVTGEVTVGEGSTYSGLSGDATSCHIHLGFRGKDGPALITLSCVDGVISGSGFLTGDDIHIFQDGNTYLNIHTIANLPGEIRGQIVLPTELSFMSSAQITPSEGEPTPRTETTETIATSFCQVIKEFLHLDNGVGEAMEIAKDTYSMKCTLHAPNSSPDIGCLDPKAVKAELEVVLDQNGMILGMMTPPDLRGGPPLPPSSDCYGQCGIYTRCVGTPVEPVPENPFSPTIEYACQPYASNGCCSPMGSCPDAHINKCVCSFDAYCCEASFDAQCVQEAKLECGGC